MDEWQPVPKPAELAERRLLEGILTAHFPVNSSLPAERELAEQLGVTRPTLREALQRLSRDGWIEIRQGKSTRVRDYWREGSLGVLAALAQGFATQTPDFVSYLLEIRILLAPAYACQALGEGQEEVISLLERAAGLPDDPAAFARYDWDLHSLLTQMAPNPVFRLLLNSFQELSLAMGEHYFAYPEGRRHSRDFYDRLLDCARQGNSREAEALTRLVMEQSLAFWQGKQG